MGYYFTCGLVLLTFITGFVFLKDYFTNRNSDSEIPEKKAFPTRVAISLFPIVLFILLFRSFAFEAFSIPSTSMLPTLKIGDNVWVKKYSYGIRLPLSRTLILPINEPQRGDVVVFTYPDKQQVNYIKRIVGLPGDKISYKDKILSINSTSIVNTFVADQPPLKVYQTEISDTPSRILIDPRIPNVELEGEWTVPDGHYFLIGDNRDNSQDSREFGFVPLPNILGKTILP